MNKHILGEPFQQFLPIAKARSLKNKQHKKVVGQYFVSHEEAFKYIHFCLQNKINCKCEGVQVVLQFLGGSGGNVH